MKIGFIGAGNMGGAIIKGYVYKTGDEVIICDVDRSKVEASLGQLPIKIVDGIKDVVKLSDIIVIAVKPNVIEDVLDEISESGADGKVIVSIAAAVSVGYIRKTLGDDTKVVRVMPNTPAMIGFGMAALYADGLVQSELDAVKELFDSVGESLWLDGEDKFDIITGISGSSPAYVYMYMEGLINAGISGGLSREDATLLASQSTLGAAKMIVESGETDPVQLRVNVCSPGGTTIEAVKVFEDEGFVEIVEKAALASTNKSKSMTK